MASKKQDNEQDQYSWIVPQEFCWIAEQNLNDQDSEVFIPAQIVGYNKQTNIATCQLSNGTDPKEIKADRLLIRNEQNETHDDMVNMDLLNEAELLQNLRKRYNENKIYTYVGPTLLAVNPFKPINDLYDNSTLIKYFSIIENFAEKNLHKKLLPHVYGLTAESFKDLFLNEKNQALVISGESGAGKTENTKYCMKFLTSLGTLEQTSQEKLTGIKDLEVRRRKSSYTAKIHNQPSIEDKILSCNPILEAFGNAKTSRNDNSSRFGKYVTIIVNKHDKMIIGAQIINYLLEKARITNQGQGERSFHIFYHFLKGGDKQMLEKYELEYPVNFEKYQYLSESKCYTVNRLDDVKLFQEVNESFQIMGFQKESDSIYSFIAAILLLGNIQFTDKTLTNDQPCSITNEDVLIKIAKLLQIDIKQLREGLTYKLRVIQKQNFMSPLNKIECNNTKDSLAKYLYERMFNLIVQKLNEIIMPQEQLDQSKTSNIGLLDIYGFEVFKENGFEQFFINYTNEKLQQLYIQYVFKQEEQVFVKEGLENYLQYLSFTDNKPVIDLLDMPPSGIFNILDDICQTKGNDEKFVNKIRQTHKNNKYFQIPKITAKPTFVIVHSAKEVEYTATVFTEKNQDEIQELILTTLLNSNNPLLSSLAQSEIETNKNKKKEKSLGSKFRSEMQYLMNDLMSCDCHFIRCIKPNEEKKADCFKPVNSLQQVRYLGVLESIKVRKQSYPIRKTYQLFYKRYAIINQDFRPYSQLCKENADFIQLTKGLFKTVFKGIDGNGNLLFGKTRVFMQNRALNDIEQVYENKLEQLNNTSRKFQKAFYTYKQLKQLKRNLQLIRMCQQMIKVKFMYKRFKDQRKKAQKIQHWYRTHLQRELIKKYRQSSLIIQSYIQLATQVQYYKQVQLSILLIQKCIRKFLSRTRLRNLLFCKNKIEEEVLSYAWNYIRNRSSIQIQKIMRGYLARMKLQEMIERVKTVGRMIREKKAATKIQTNFKMQINRKKFLHWKKAAMKIQAFVKMNILSAYYHQLKISTLKIQKAIRKFLIKKHIRLERLQAYVDQCNFKNILSDEQVFSLGKSDGDNNTFQNDVSEMYYIQKTIQNNRIKSKQNHTNQKQINPIQSGVAKNNNEKEKQIGIIDKNKNNNDKKKILIRPEFSSVKSKEQILNIINKNPIQQQQQQQLQENQQQSQSQKIIKQNQQFIKDNIEQQKKRNKTNKINKNNYYQNNEENHQNSLEIVNSDSSIDFQDILERNQYNKSNNNININNNQPLKIEDQKQLTNESNITKQSYLRLKQTEPIYNNTKQAILSQMSSIESSLLQQQQQQMQNVHSSNNNNNNFQNQQNIPIQDMYYYTNELESIHNNNNKYHSKNNNNSQKNNNNNNIISNYSSLNKSSTNSPIKIQSQNQSRQSPQVPNKQNKTEKKINQLIDTQYKLTLQPQKIYILSHLIDFEIMSDTCDIYPPNGWSQYYQSLFQSCYNKKDYLQSILIGETHSIAITNNSIVYSWGWNDFGQLGMSNSKEQENGNENENNSANINQVQLKEINNIEQSSIGNDFSIILSKEGRLYGWGKNNKGQLGFYDEDDTSNIIDIPIELISIKEDSIKSIKCKMNSVYIILNNGSVYTNQKYSPYTKIQFNQSVDRISCGFNFSIFLTNSGQIYSLGKNQHGQLGLNDNIERKEPTLINYFKNHQISQVECGFAHVVILTNYGRVYIWGWGENGQLGLNDYSDYYEPQSYNVIQVCATRTSTLLLLNNSEIIWFGTNQSIQYINTPTHFKITNKYKQLEGMHCMKLSSSWSKTLGIVYGTFGFSKDIPDNQVASTCNILTKKWIKNNIDTIKPPIVKSIYHKFPQQYMDKNESPKKQQQKELNTPKKDSPQIIKIEDSSQIINIQEANVSQFISQENNQVQQEQQQQKLKEIRHKIEFLKTLPQKQLRQIDKQLLELYKQKQFDQILSNKKYFL